MPRYTVVGVMSGSSLDGIDLALCDLEEQGGKWTYAIREARTVPYDPTFRDRLLSVMSGSALELARLDRELGDVVGTACRELINGAKVDLISSHGHTIFHRPDESLTTQIGNGARIAVRSGVTTICDLRSKDLALGGQGAPLIPMGERLLFPEHKAFLNMGGICNISLHGPDRILGYDVCIANQAMNFLANEAGKEFDEDGGLGRSGRIQPELLGSLNSLSFHQQAPPRSLGRELFNEQIKPLVDDKGIPLADRMRTMQEHIAMQIGQAFKGWSGKILASGGGTHNKALIEILRHTYGLDLEIPDTLTVDYKESLVFAVLGVLRLRGEVNTLSSVTGAKADSIGGAVHLPN